MCVHCAVGWWQCLLIMRDPLRPNQCLSWGSSPSLSLTRLFYFILTHRKRLTWPCIDGHNQLQEIWLVLLCSFGSWGGGSSQFRKSTGNVSEILTPQRKSTSNGSTNLRLRTASSWLRLLYSDRKSNFLCGRSCVVVSCRFISIDGSVVINHLPGSCVQRLSYFQARFID